MINEFNLLFLYIEKFGYMINKIDPQMKNVIENFNVDYFLWFSKWVQTLFTYNFSFYMCLKFWDIFINSEIDSILCISLGVLGFISDKVKTVSYVEDFLKICDELYHLEDTEANALFEYINRNRHQYKLLIHSEN